MQARIRFLEATKDYEYLKGWFLFVNYEIGYCLYGCEDAKTKYELWQCSINSTAW